MYAQTSDYKKMVKFQTTRILLQGKKSRMNQTTTEVKTRTNSNGFQLFKVIRRHKSKVKTMLIEEK